MNARPGKITLLAIGALLPVLAQASDAPPLAKNPFSRPPSQEIQLRGEPAQNSGPRGTLTVRVTMVGNGNNLANVDGRILRPGDEISGYTLLQVFEDRAVFSRNGEKLTVFVKPVQVENND